MGFRHLQAAYTLTLGSPGRKSLLCVLAYRACDTCGIAWPGVKWLMASTEMSERSVQTCLRELTGAGLLQVHRYSRGGRGVSTEYVVLPQVAKLSTAPCGECADRMKNPAMRAGLSESTPQDVRGLDAKPRKSSSETPQNVGYHQSEKHNQSGSALPREVETALTGRQGSDPAAPIPPAVQIALRRARETAAATDTETAP